MAVAAFKNALMAAAVFAVPAALVAATVILADGVTWIAEDIAHVEGHRTGTD
ncbi:MAG: hypothetical protein HN977_04010 [Gammaproteobacteria bacterium]|nr:hypothetical protein [Gammaproteobacteria bacterium]